MTASSYNAGGLVIHALFHCRVLGHVDSSATSCLQVPTAAEIAEDIGH